MSPEAQLHEHVLPQLQQAEVLHQIPEAPHQHVEATPHIHEHHEHDGHNHHIEIRGAHACAPDCPEHGGGHHTHEHHHSHEHAQEAHTIQRKAPEHACSADCPDHGGGHHNHATHREHKESHHAPHKIERKTHACGADCPEHGHRHDHHEHNHDTQKVELKEHHACAPDCPEHSHASHKHHEHQDETSHDIVQKASEHACGADCPEHGPNKHHEHHQEHHVEAKDKADSSTEQQAEATRMQQRIEEELHARQPQAVRPAKPDTQSEATVERPAAHARQAAAESFRRTVEESVAVEPFVEAAREKTEQEVSDTAAVQSAESQFITAEADDTETASESRPTLPAAMYIEKAVEPDVSGMDQTSEATIAEGYEKTFPAPDEANLLSPPMTEHTVGREETVFDIPAMLANLPTQPSTQSAESIRDEHIPMPFAIIPELPATPEPLNTAATTIAETIAQQYLVVAETLGAGEGDMPPSLSPAQISELRTIVAVIQARAIQSENLATPANVIPQEFIRLLQLLGFENPAKIFEKYIQQYGYGFYDNLLAQLFELLRVAKPIEAPVLQASSPTDATQTDWTATLGKAAVLLVMLARQFVPSQALHLDMKQPKGAVN